MNKKSCPSAPIKKGHYLIGEFKASNSLDYSKESALIDSAKIKEIRANGSSNYRASMPCQAKGCMNWNGSKCTVPDQMRDYFMNVQTIDSIENCTIRSNCQWFAQEQYSACKICPYIKTEFYDG